MAKRGRMDTEEAEEVRGRKRRGPLGLGHDAKERSVVKANRSDKDRSARLGPDATSGIRAQEESLQWIYDELMKPTIKLSSGRMPLKGHAKGTVTRQRPAGTAEVLWERGGFTRNSPLAWGCPQACTSSAASPCRVWAWSAGRGSDGSRKKNSVLDPGGDLKCPRAKSTTATASGPCWASAT